MITTVDLSKIDKIDKTDRKKDNKEGIAQLKNERNLEMPMK